MAKKPPVQVHVQSSDFKSLLNAQKESLQALHSIDSTMKTLKLTELANLIETKKIDDENDKEIKIAKDAAKDQKEHIKIAKEMAKSLKSIKESKSEKSEEAMAIANIAKSLQTFRTMSERFKDFGKKVKEGLSFSGIKTGLLKTFNIGGVFNKALEKEKFIKQQRKLGSEDTRADLSEKFEKASIAAKAIKKNEAELSQFKKDTGLSESQLAKTKEGKRLLGKREELTNEYAKHDLKANLVRNESPTQEFADAGQQEERDNESLKVQNEQHDLLVKIEENTRGASPDQKAKPEKKEEAGGGLLGGLLGGGGAGKALNSLKQFGVGMVLVAASLWVASKAFQSFAEVEWEDVGKGLVALGGLAGIALLLDKVKGSMIGTAIGLGAMALATWGISEAFQTFSDLDWGTILKGFTVIGVLAGAGALLGEFAPLMILFGAGLAALGAGVWVIGQAFQEMGEAFNIFVEGIERLSNVGFDGLAGVAAGLALLGPAMALFAAGNVAAGISSLVTGFLSAVTGKKTPIDQLVEIGNAGKGINEAGSGMERLARGMAAFKDINGDSLKAMKQFPWEEATKFVAAGGSMSVDGAKVYNQSKGNADNDASTAGKGGNKTNVVNAPVNNVTKQTQVIKSPIRNKEPTNAQYMKSRYITI